MYFTVTNGSSLASQKEMPRQVPLCLTPTANEMRRRRVSLDEGDRRLDNRIVRFLPMSQLIFANALQSVSRTNIFFRRLCKDQKAVVSGTNASQPPKPPMTGHAPGTSTRAFVEVHLVTEGAMDHHVIMQYKLSYTIHACCLRCY